MYYKHVRKNFSGARRAPAPPTELAPLSVSLIIHEPGTSLDQYCLLTRNKSPKKAIDPRDIRRNPPDPFRCVEQNFGSWGPLTGHIHTQYDTYIGSCITHIHDVLRMYDSDDPTLACRPDIAHPGGRRQEAPSVTQAKALIPGTSCRPLLDAGSRKRHSCLTKTLLAPQTCLFGAFSDSVS